MTRLDDTLVPRVLEIVADLGKTVAFKKKNLGAYDPTTGERPLSGITTYPNIKVTPPQLKKRKLPGETTEERVLEIVIPAQGLAFSPEDEDMLVLIDGEDFEIAAVELLYSGDLVAAYVCSLRK